MQRSHVLKEFLTMKGKFPFMYCKKYTLLLRDFHTLCVPRWKCSCKYIAFFRWRFKMCNVGLAKGLAKRRRKTFNNVLKATRWKCQWRMIIESFHMT